MKLRSEIRTMKTDHAIPYNKKLFRKLVISSALAGSLTLLSVQSAHADLTTFAGQYTNQKEEEAARATQLIYNQLQAGGCDDFQTVESTTCSGEEFRVWSFVREVVHNGNILTPGNQLPTAFSLRRGNVTLLGRALQWCSGEELASLNTLSTKFLGAQANTLAARISALRFASGSRVGDRRKQNQGNAEELLASGMNVPVGSQALIGAASADRYEDSFDSADDDEETQVSWSAWSAYVSGGTMRGDKDVTTDENEYSFSGPNFTLGVDNRLTNNWVVGAVLGYQASDMDFATVATVEASSDLTGLSLTPYAMYQSDRWFLSISLGYQDMKFDTHRRINYGPGAAPVPAPGLSVSHDTFADSESHAKSISSHDTVGLSFRPFGGLTIEPSISLEYQHVTIGSFTEQDLNNAGFNFAVEEQTFESLEGVPALHIQYTITPGFGVWVPYIDVQHHQQFSTDPREVRAQYAAVQDVVNSAASFVIRTDAPDESYQVLTAGFSAVLRGTQNLSKGPSGGVQIYANYRKYIGIEDFTQDSFSAGLRYEF